MGGIGGVAGAAPVAGVLQNPEQDLGLFRQSRPRRRRRRPGELRQPLGLLLVLEAPLPPCLRVIVPQSRSLTYFFKRYSGWINSTAFGCSLVNGIMIRRPGNADFRRAIIGWS
jgi:hypothetical protein